MENLDGVLKELKYLESSLYLKDFLLTWGKSLPELKRIILVAEALKYLRDKNISTRVFDSGLAVSIFRNSSTKTRFSFSAAANMLGLQIQDLEDVKSRIFHGETVRETTNMISFLTAFIGIRDNMYLGTGNAYMNEVSEALEEGFVQGVLPQRPAVINLQCDLDHPTQSMADLLHIKKHFGSFKDLFGKKIAVTWAYSPGYGKPLSVPQGIVGLLTRFGMDVVLAHPEGYDLLPEVVKNAEKSAKSGGGSFKRVHSMEEAFKDADIVYPKSWTPLKVMRQRTKRLEKNDEKGLAELKKNCLEANAKFKDWECTEKMMKLTKEASVLYMHCLPADITGVSCERGEVRPEVFEKYRIQTYKQAGYKPYIIASMMLNSRFFDPAAILERLETNAVKRINV